MHDFTDTQRQTLTARGFTQDHNADNYIIEAGPDRFIIVDIPDAPSLAFGVGLHNVSDCIEYHETDDFDRALALVDGFQNADA